MAIDSSLQDFARSELEKLVRIPSISFSGFEPKFIDDSAQATQDLLRRVGFKNVEITSIDGCFPYVLAESDFHPEKPTCLLYAHHDVQPPGRLELWSSPPFEPQEREGRLFGRGTADDKAGILVHAAAMEYFRKKGEELPVNLKVLIEGEEEIGSSHLPKFLEQNRERLRSDVIIVTDTANIQSGVPTLTVSLRGLVVVEIVLKSMKAPLHSGMWGGAIPDPVSILINILASLVDFDGNIQLTSIGKSKRVDYSSIPVSKAEFADQAGLMNADLVKDDFLDRTWNRASFAINAIQASSEKLANNVICDRAYARLGIRISKNESARRVLEELKEKIMRELPQGIEIELRHQEPAEAWSIDPYADSHRWAFKAAETALEKVFERELVYAGCGATIPFIGPFERAFGAPVLTLGVEDPYTLAHSENESLLLSDFYKCIESEILLFSELAKQIRERQKPRERA
jgi:acetylornithine deacetylase/succinyl-diaminopimelate desuccinylase-like protein